MARTTIYQVAADFLLITHVAFVVFVVGGLLLVVAGGLAGWGWVRNPWFRLAHLLGIAFVAVQAWLGRICFLTIWEMALRERAGQETYEGSFIEFWLQRLLYYDAPAWVFTTAYTVFGLVVAATWIGVRPHPFRRPADRISLAPRGRPW